MPFFYKHIVPTGLKRGTTREKPIEKWHFCETVFYKQLFSTSRKVHNYLHTQERRGYNPRQRREKLHA